MEGTTSNGRLAYSMTLRSACAAFWTACRFTACCPAHDCNCMLWHSSLCYCHHCLSSSPSSTPLSILFSNPGSSLHMARQVVLVLFAHYAAVRWLLSVSDMHACWIASTYWTAGAAAILVKVYSAGRDEQGGRTTSLQGAKRGALGECTGY